MTQIRRALRRAHRYRPHFGAISFRQFAEEKSRPDGLFIGNDLTTSQVYPLLAQHGIKIGTDLKLVSCDAEEARLSGMHPRPASIDIGGERSAIAASIAFSIESSDPPVRRSSFKWPPRMVVAPAAT